MSFRAKGHESPAPPSDGGGSSSGGTFGTAFLTPVDAVAGADASYIQWGDGAAPLDGVPVYLDQYAQSLDSFDGDGNPVQPFTWLDISDPASPRLTAGTYIIKASIGPDAVITTTDFAVVSFYVTNTGTATGGTTVPTLVSYDPYGYNLVHEELLVTAGGVLGIYTQAIKADGSATFGNVNFRCGVTITQFSPSDASGGSGGGPGS